LNRESFKAQYLYLFFGVDDSVITDDSTQSRVSDALAGLGVMTGPPGVGPGSIKLLFSC